MSKSGPVLKGLKRGAEKSMTPVQFPQFSTCLAAADAKSLQLCPTLHDPHRQQPTRLPCPWDSPGKNTGVGWLFFLQCIKVKSTSHVQLFTTPWIAAYQAPSSVGFSGQEYWSGLPLPSPKENHRHRQINVGLLYEKL